MSRILFLQKSGAKKDFVWLSWYCITGAPQGSVLGPLLFILYTFELFRIIGNYVVNYADDTTI